MANVFNTDVKVGGVIDGHNVGLAISGGGTDFLGQLAQSMQIQFNAQMTRLKALGDPHVYFVNGIPDGSFAIQRAGGLASFISGNSVCATKDILVRYNSPYLQCRSDGSGSTVPTAAKRRTVTLSGVVFSSVGITANADNFMIYDSIGGMFVSLKEQSS